MTCTKTWRRRRQRCELDEWCFSPLRVSVGWQHCMLETIYPHDELSIVAMVK